MRADHFIGDAGFRHSAWLSSWLLLCFITQVSAEGFSSPAEGTSPLGNPDLAAQVENISASQRQLNEQLSRVLQENESLSRRLDALTADEPAGVEAADYRIPPSPLGMSTAGGLDTFMPPKYEDPQLYDPDDGGLKSLFDSFSHGKGKPWYEKLSIRGYSQVRFERAVKVDHGLAEEGLFGDRSISAETGTFSIRRARLILAEDVSDHLFLYFQSDFANNPADGTNTFFAQIRDLYGDIYLDTTKVHRLRVGQSKIPWGFEEMQSSGNRVPLDRSDAIDSGNSPNQRDLGVFYYWTPEEKQKLLKDLVDGGLKGAGNYGIFGFGVYNGQGGSELDENRSLHTVARFTWPFQLPSGQAVEMSIQGYTGKFVVAGTDISPQGNGLATPAGTGYDGVRDERIAGSFVWYPQPFGLQAEWNFGRGPALNDAQTLVTDRALHGGYIMSTYKIDTQHNGIFIPFTRYQHYHGGYKSVKNAPYGTHDEYSLGVEWQIRKELELVLEYGYVDGVSLRSIDTPGEVSYRDFHGQLLRSQLQINY